MIYVRFEIFFLILILIGLVFLMFLWFYYDRRQKQFLRGEQIQKAFHCLKCNLLYSDKREVELSICPKCGYHNDRLQF